MPRSVAIMAVLALLLGLPAQSLAVDGAGTATAPEAYVSVERVLEADETGVARPADVAWDDRAGNLVVTDALRPSRATAMSTAGVSRGSVTAASARALNAVGELAADRIDLSASGADPETVALDPSSGHLFAWAPATSILWELDPSGIPVARRDLADAGLEDVTGMTVAPSADSTDDPDEQAVYMADAGAADGTGASITEIALVEPMLDTTAIAAATTSVTLVQTINTGAGGAWNPDSPDPSGLAYIPTGAAGVPSSRQDRLVSADGEVEETTGAGFHDVNVWFAPRDGSAQTSTMDTTAAGTDPTNKEPVGAAYDSVRNELYISKDGSKGRIWVYDMTSGAQVRTFTVNGAPYNNADPEGLAFDSANNILYMVDSVDNDLVKVLPGPGGVIGVSGDQVSNYDLQQYGQSEPEGLDVDPGTGNIWVVSNKVSGKGIPDPMLEISPNGALVSSVSIAAAEPHSPGGLAVAPPSNGSGGFGIYVADRGVDNNEQPNENDGKIYEFSTGGGGGNPPVANFSASQTAGTFTVNFVDTSTNSPTEWLWDFDPSVGDDGSTEPQPSYTYAGPGTYQVTLTATNEFGSDSVTKPVTVTEEPPPPTGNLLTNGGFELDANGDTRPDDWTTDTAFTRSDVIPAQEGAFVGRHLTTSERSYTVYAEASVAGGESYVLSGMLNAPTNADAFKFQFKIKWRGAGGNISTTLVHQIKDDTAGAWRSFSGTVTAPAGATTGRVMMVANGLNGTVYVDGLVFQAAP
ncbi:MAG: PKD domain-containing protein [Candidatus Limnocylindria bacterium]